MALCLMVRAVVTGFVLFHGSFSADFAGFLLYIVVWLAPWFGRLLAPRRPRCEARSGANHRGLTWNIEATRHFGVRFRTTNYRLAPEFRVNLRHGRRRSRKMPRARVRTTCACACACEGRLSEA